jgi:predicted PhzF superfamily epimerase YddE/YHI9
LGFNCVEGASTRLNIRIVLKMLEVNNMEIRLFQVDAFTTEVFKGNPAAVCPLENWPGDDVLQGIALENNLSETAFFVKDESYYALRWFTPKIEVDLCGHATLASAYVIFSYLEPSLEEVVFSSKSGLLKVSREGDRLAMIFPARPPAPCSAPDILIRGLRKEPSGVLRSERDYMAVYRSQQEIEELLPGMPDLEQLDALGIMVTAPGEKADFVSRFFAPRAGIPEDPVTGSSHCTLVPYWSEKLNKKSLYAQQLSERGGELFCEDLGEKVKIAGKAVRYLEGTMFI